MEKIKNECSNKPKMFTQVVASSVACLGAISIGMSLGWASPIIPKLQSPDTPIQIQESDIVWIESIYLMAGLFGFPIIINVVDKFGRKATILIAALITLIHWIIVASAKNIWLLHVARFIGGAAADVSFVATSMYVAEISDERIRGLLGSIIYTFLLFGVLLIYSVGPFVSIPISCAVGALFVLMQFIILPFIPETPYYLLIKKQTIKAKKSLRYFRGLDDVDQELVEINCAVIRQSIDNGTFLELITVDSNRKGLIIIIALHAFVQFMGVGVICMNLHTILSEANVITNSNVVAIIFSVVMLISAMIASLFIDKLGRKIMLVISSALSGIAMASLASYFAIQNAGYYVTDYNWIPLVAVLAYAIVYNWGIGALPFILYAELFPTNIKAKCMALSDNVYVIFSSASIYFYNFLAPMYGIHVPLFIFSAIPVLAVLFTIYYIPETKGKTLEEIQFLLKGRKSLPRASQLCNPIVPLLNDTKLITVTNRRE